MARVIIKNNSTEPLGGSPVDLIFSPAVFNRYVLALDKAVLLQVRT